MIRGFLGLACIGAVFTGVLLLLSLSWGGLWRGLLLIIGAGVVWSILNSMDN